jgi:hypothetical protein
MDPFTVPIVLWFSVFTKMGEIYTSRIQDLQVIRPRCNAMRMAGIIAHRGCA